MPWAKHWDIRRYIKDFRDSDPKFEKGAEARYTILDDLLLRSNLRLRSFVGVDTIMADTGFAKPVVAGALAWLFDRGAIYNVPPQYRVGQEATLHNRKYVFQLTGIIRLGENWVRYLLFSQEDAAMMLEEWRSIGMEIPVDLEFLIAKEDRVFPDGSLGEPNDGGQGSLGERSLSEGSLKSPLSSTSLSPSSTSGNQVVIGGQAAEVAPTARRKTIHDLPANMIFGDDEDQHESKKDKPLTRHDNIINHEMVVCFMDILRLSTLASGMVKDLTEPIRLRTEEGYLSTGRSLLDMWDTEPGFAEFCRVRIPQTQTWSKPMTPPNIIKHLTKLNKPDGAGGFYKWRGDNPTLCEVVEDEDDNTTPRRSDEELAALNMIRFGIGIEEAD